MLCEGRCSGGVQNLVVWVRLGNTQDYWDRIEVIYDKEVLLSHDDINITMLSY